MGSADGSAHAGKRRGFIASRWHGEVPLGTLFWRDMVVVATLANVAMLAVAAALLAAGLPLWLPIAAFLSPLPWNLFLLIAVHRTADRQHDPHAGLAKAGSLVWFVVAALL